MILQIKVNMTSLEFEETLENFIGKQKVWAKILLKKLY